MRNQNFQIKTLQLLICLVSVVLIAPFLYISQYNVPGASDDFFHGFYLLEEGGYFSGVWEWYSSGYNSRYSNALFMQVPGRPFLSFGFGAVFPVISFSFLFVSIYSFVKAILPTKKNIEVVVFSLVIFTFFFRVYS